MKYSVPQFIDVEDKVIGPLTIKQFGYIIFAFILLAFYWVLFGISIPFILLALPTLGLFTSLAFLKINGRPFQYFLLSLFGYVTKGTRTWVWRRTLSSTLKPRSEEPEEEKNEQGAEKMVSKTGIHKLAQVLDTGTSTRAAVDLDTVRIAERVRTKRSDVVQ